jgi:hypothetical protein
MRVFSGAWSVLSCFVTVADRTEMKPVTKAIATACGVAAGTLIYTRFISSTHEFEWGRAIFVGLVSAVVSAVWPAKKSS